MSPVLAWGEGGPAIDLPSGQGVTFLDVVNGVPSAGGLAVRFRFLAPEIARVGGTVTADAALGDMQVLCDTYAIPRIASTGPQPSQIIISLSDRDVPFGEPDPNATQYFEAYSIVDGACVVEEF
jgi:hypothetical protein